MPSPSAAKRRSYRLGLQAEDVVASLLQEQGWSVLDRRWRGGGGELDLVVEQGGHVRFVEVKLRTNAEDGWEVFDPEKMLRVKSAAEAWLAGWTGPVVDCCVMAALLEPGLDGGWQLQLLDDAD